MTKAKAIAMLKRIQEPEAWEPQINQAAIEALDMAIEALSQESSEDVISRHAAIDKAVPLNLLGREVMMVSVIELENLPSAQPEPLTDKEQRIFLAAMGREEKVCKEVDAEMTREPYEDSLVRVCHEITRKVKGALWT